MLNNKINYTLLSVSKLCHTLFQSVITYVIYIIILYHILYTLVLNFQSASIIKYILTFFFYCLLWFFAIFTTNNLYIFCMPIKISIIHRTQDT